MISVAAVAFILVAVAVLVAATAIGDGFATFFGGGLIGVMMLLVGADISHLNNHRDCVRYHADTLMMPAAEKLCTDILKGGKK
jgi:hypothetical protein